MCKSWIIHQDFLTEKEPEVSVLRVGNRCQIHCKYWIFYQISIPFDIFLILKDRLIMINDKKTSELGLTSVRFFRDVVLYTKTIIIAIIRFILSCQGR